MDDFCVLSPTAILGYGFPADSFERALKAAPDSIGCDGGSTDQGPGDLGLGTLHVSRGACARDLELMLVGARRLGIPLLIGTAGGAGAEPHVSEMRNVVLEIAREHGMHFSLALIKSDLAEHYLHERIDAGATAPLDGGVQLTHDVVEECNRMVGVMGPEPYIAAVKQGADVVIAGRSSDAAIFAAGPLLRGAHPGSAWHAGKILECAAASAEPMAPSDCMLAWITGQEFEVEPSNPRLRCTPLSVAAHTMYENPSPYLLQEPSGLLDTRDSKFESVNSRRVRITGSHFVPTDRYSIKIEGTRLAGYRTIAIGVSRDPEFISQIDSYLDRVRQTVAERVKQVFDTRTPSYTLQFQTIGNGGGLVARRTQADVREVGLLISVVAPSQDAADAILAIARTHVLHCELAGRSGVLSNLAFPIAPTDLPTGPLYVFALNHVVYPNAWQDIFKVQMERI